jgi:hypothetical protein
MVLVTNCDPTIWRLARGDELHTMNGRTKVQAIRVVRRIGQKQRARLDPGRRIPQEILRDDAFSFVEGVNSPRQDSTSIVDQRVELVSLRKARDAAANPCIWIRRVLADLERFAVNEQKRGRWPTPMEDVDKLAHVCQHLGPTQSTAHR